MAEYKPKTRRPRGASHKSDPLHHGAWTGRGISPLTSPILEMRSAKTQTSRGDSLGLRLTDTESVIQHLRNGLTLRSVERLSKAMEISLARLATSTNIAQRTLARRKKEGRLQLAESERVFRLANLFDSAVEALGGVEQARQWFKMPLQALGGKSPLEYSDTEIGAREVEDLLGRLEHGVFS